MGQFGWLCAAQIPAEFDLRVLGWEHVPTAEAAAAPAVPLLLADERGALAQRERSLRARCALLGVADSMRRAHFLALGFGDVLPPRLALPELAARIARLGATLQALPRRRRHGLLELDLLSREGWVGQRRLGLHPREFMLLWRLAETPGEPVGAATLLSEVWHLNFRPETNSLAVHVCRLRAKLAIAGLPQILRTMDSGAYLLMGAEPRAIPLAHDDVGLDEHVRQVAPLAFAAAEQEP